MELLHGQIGRPHMLVPPPLDCSVRNYRNDAIFMGRTSFVLSVSNAKKMVETKTDSQLNMGE